MSQVVREIGRRPVHEVRKGRIRAAIWEVETENHVRYNVTFSRLYKDGEHWSDSKSFGRDDLLLVAKVADEAHTWIFETIQNSGVSGGDTDEAF